MIPDDLFQRALAAVGREPNEAQQLVLDAPQNSPLFVVAGPGTGKTACLTMRMLKLIFTGGVSPRGILATTFTKKAAAELRSRLLSWGYGVLEHLMTKEKLGKLARLWLERVDINQVRTGTIDGICEELLRDFRDPGADPPILADNFVSRTLLMRHGLLNGRRDKDPDFELLLAALDGKIKQDGGINTWGWHLGRKTEIAQALWDRRFQDQTDWGSFCKGGTNPTERNARKILDLALTDYDTELKNRLMVDFSQLEQTVLDRLDAGGLREFTDQLMVVLVDEYQDTNLLQESLYFQLAQRCNGALTVVGDDDQSLYRFRGATVELFRDFETRYMSFFKRQPRKIFLNENYRSSATIVEFVNAYVNLDAGYQTVRVNGKPALKNPTRRAYEIPILGMFRDGVERLASDLATFIYQVTKGKGYRLESGEVIKVDSARNGDVGDCALLCSSPQEFTMADESRLPLRLKEELRKQPTQILVFNPRGQDFASIPEVQRLGGLLLCCLDRNGAAEDVVAKGLNRDIRSQFQAWATLVEEDMKRGRLAKPLCDFVDGWSKRTPLRQGYRWPKSSATIDLLYALVHWLPELHDDPEGQVYLEVFTRQLGACEQVSPFKARMVYDPMNIDLSLRSVGHLLLYFLAPIASGTAMVDEDLMETLPRDRLNILSIHQSKGLEFPLTIVDVGSDFKMSPKSPRGHPANAFKRFPRDASPPHRMEDLFRPYTPLRGLTRNGQDRAFDDLFRLYFVAFSRPQDVLLLVGLNASKPGFGQIRNVATGWDRREVSHWSSKKPFVEI